MADFVIDTVGGIVQEQTNETHQKPNNEFLKLLFSDFNECLSAKFGNNEEKVNENRGLSHSFENLMRSHNRIEVSQRDIEVKKALEKSVLLDSKFEKLHTVPPIEISDRNLRKQRKAEAGKTKGKKWYGLPATEMTEEVKHDLEVLQMRAVLDPKHFYKKNDLKVLPKYFQIGKVMDSPLDFYNNRLLKKERKKTLVDELLADAEFSKYNKRKYKEIITEKQKTHYKAWRQAKRLKKKKK